MEAIATPDRARLALARSMGESLDGRLQAAAQLALALGATAGAQVALENAVRELSPLDRALTASTDHFVLSPVQTPWGNRIDVLSVGRSGGAEHSGRHPSTRGTGSVLSATLEAGVLGLEGRPVELRAARVPLGTFEATGWDVAACALPYPGLDASGDAVLVQSGESGAIRVSVIDALGHGDIAAKSAAGLVAHLRAAQSQTLERAVATAHAQRAAAPRGAALSVLELDARGAGSYVGVGNVEAIALHRASRPISRSGTVGVALARLVVDPVSVPPGGTLVLVTDGFVVRWQSFTLAALAPLPAPLVLCALLATATRRTDDATAVVVRRDGASP